MKMNEILERLEELAENACDDECYLVDPCKECQAFTAINQIKEFIEELYEEILG